MKQLFLSSQIDVVAKHIYKKIEPSLTGTRTAFISTAAEVIEGDKEWLEKNKQGLIDCGLDVFDYTLTNKSYNQIVEDLKDINILHVNGGDNFYLLLQAMRSGFDKFVKDFVSSGRIYIGSSAGSIIASTDTEISKSPGRETYANQLATFKGFSLVDFVVLPHWGHNNNHAERRKQRVLDAFQEKNKIILLNDYQYVQVEDDMYKIVDSRYD